MVVNSKCNLNSRIVFFLGAGASRYAGYPLTRTFLDDMKYSIAKSHSYSPTALKTFRSVLDFRTQLSRAKEYVSADFDNIETLYSTAEMYAMAYPDRVIHGTEEGIRGADLPGLIGKAIWEMCRWRPVGEIHEDPHHHVHLLKMLAQWMGPQGLGNIIFITTNYDILLELACWRAQMQSCYGSTVKFDSIEGTLVTPGAGLKILKLHGSVNWFIGNEKVVCDGNLQRFERSPLSPSYLWPAVQSSEYEPRAGMTPLIVPPTFAKSAPCKTLSSIWAEAVQAIAGAVLIVFIGYSFPRTDTFINHLLHVGLFENGDLRRVMVIDPDPKIGDYARDDLFTEVSKRGSLIVNDGGIQSATTTDLQTLITMLGVSA